MFTTASRGPARALRAFAVAALALAATGCASVPLFAGMAPREIDRTWRDPDPEPPLRTVVLVSVDGLAPWVMADTETPNLDALARNGTAAIRAETIVPSFTLPSHTSMISGVGPEIHHVDWNAWRPNRHINVPTVFTACRHARLRCGLVSGKRKFAHFAVEEVGVEFYQYGDEAEDVLDLALDYIEERQPHFVMIHLAEVDVTGHIRGWGSNAQRDQIRRIDEAFGDFLEDAREERGTELSVIVTADHGGEGRRHGSADERHVRIPWIAWGSGVPRGGRIPEVRTTDTAATILGLLGMPAPVDWAGRSHFPFYVDAETVDVGADGSGGGQ
ncbi:MAG: alkaline phosphatase family protein [Deltaproteobacteria bacterium]|nr:alkaline phosphatase family protein [Deltaproteobacteria bacterium]MBW2446371.1 alkaline phosphatase family protein [Deltaproteobacteria bacterium]